mmetsp:Transcript_24012/g.80704  ORF Transcript_24012/g.80704 Transcript_24012/m.80704 type:complete len:592 (-) Transcript_24012:63-1838(-)
MGGHDDDHPELPAMSPNTTARANREAVVAHAAAQRTLNKKELGFFHPAVQLLHWGEVQRSRHASWTDLFQDIIFVAAAFKCGEYLKANFDTLEGIYVCVGCGFSVVATWSHNLQYRARYNGKSNYHKFLEVVYGLFAAVSAHNVVTDETSFRLYNQYAFVSAVIMCRLLSIVRRAELVFVPTSSEVVRHESIEAIARLGVEVCVLAISYGLSRPYEVATVLVAAWVLKNLGFALPVIMGRHTAQAVVPVHVEYTLQRLGELVILVLGEGMLSLAIAETTLESRDVSACDAACWESKVLSAVSFTSGFALLAAFMYLYYRINPSDRHHHAVRRSPARGLIWVMSHSVLAVSGIIIGVSIKVIHPYAASDKVKRGFVPVLSVAMCVSFAILSAHQVLHPGLVDFVLAPDDRARRLSLFTLKALLAASALAMPWLPTGTLGFVFQLYGCMVGCLCALIIAVEKPRSVERRFWAHADKHLREIRHLHEQPHPDEHHHQRHHHHHHRDPDTEGHAPPFVTVGHAPPRGVEVHRVDSTPRLGSPRGTHMSHVSHVSVAISHAASEAKSEPAPGGSQESDDESTYSDTEDYNAALAAA